MRTFLCSVPMGAGAYFICSMGNWIRTGYVVEKILLLASGIVIGIGIYMLCSYWMKNEEMLFLLNVVRRKRQPAADK